MIVMEPANVEQIKLGQPLVCRGQEYGFLVDVVVAFTPDPEWVCQQITAGVEIPKAARKNRSSGASLQPQQLRKRATCLVT